MVTVLAVVISIGAGVIGGVFFAFSTFVMKALAQLPASQGIAAMQRINVTVLNPLFLGVFMGTAALAVGCVLASVIEWGSARAVFLLMSGLLYLVGTFLVTIVFNVPMNERLARMSQDSSEAADYWLVYASRWTRWNHVRAAASIASATSGAITLAL